MVTRLVAEVAEVMARHGAPLAFIDNSGAVLGYADGRPTGPPAADTAWRTGVDIAAGARHADVQALCYTRDQDRTAVDTARYRELTGGDRALRVVLRPDLPDTTDTDQLAERVARAGKTGADAVDFYHYGLASLTDLDRIAPAIRKGAAP